MKKATAIKHSTDELKLKVLQAKAVLGADFRLRAVYEYFYGKTTESEFYHIQNCYYLKVSDEEVTKKLEALADNKLNLPVNPKTK